MKLTDIWYSAVHPETGATFGAKGKMLPGENKEQAVYELKKFVHESIEKGKSNAESISTNQV